MATEIPRFHAETRQQWRSWLQVNHLSTRAVWLVSWRKRTGRPAMTYHEAVSECLAFGWVDSKPAKLDDDRTMLYFTPRKPGSAWSRPNKLRIEELERHGLLAEQGERVVAAAKADGSWTLLDEVENLVIPDDLARVFELFPGSAEKWEEFPRSAKRGILEWIAQAKTPGTRHKRMEETASKAQQGERAHQWQSKA